MQTPCSDYRETKGLIYFARMLDKIRLDAQGCLEPGYFLGVEDPTFFDARCTRFLGINYDKLVARTLEDGSDEEILDWCFEHGRKPGDEEILFFNSFLSKRGWRATKAVPTCWPRSSVLVGGIVMIFRPGSISMKPKKAGSEIAQGDASIGVRGRPAPGNGASAWAVGAKKKPAERLASFLENGSGTIERF